MSARGTAMLSMVLAALALCLGVADGQGKDKATKRSGEVKGWGKKGKAKHTEPAQPEGKGQTFEGVILCAKHDLKQSEKCEAVLQVTKENGEQVVYYFQVNDRKKDIEQAALHKKAKAEVSGMLAVAGGKEFITLTEFKLTESPKTTEH
jgi:hypothetical protein